MYSYICYTVLIKNFIKKKNRREILSPFLIISASIFATRSYIIASIFCKINLYLFSLRPLRTRAVTRNEEYAVECIIIQNHRSRYYYCFLSHFDHFRNSFFIELIFTHSPKPLARSLAFIVRKLKTSNHKLISYNFKINIESYMRRYYCNF